MFSIPEEHGNLNEAMNFCLSRLNNFWWDCKEVLMCILYAVKNIQHACSLMSFFLDQHPDEVQSHGRISQPLYSDTHATTLGFLDSKALVNIFHQPSQWFLGEEGLLVPIIQHNMDLPCTVAVQAIVCCQTWAGKVRCCLDSVQVNVTCRKKNHA